MLLRFWVGGRLGARLVLSFAKVTADRVSDPAIVRVRSPVFATNAGRLAEWGYHVDVSVPSRDPVMRASPSGCAGALVALFLFACDGTPQTAPRQPARVAAATKSEPTRSKPVEVAQRPVSDPSLFAATTFTAPSRVAAAAKVVEDLPVNGPLFVDRLTAPPTTACRAVAYIGDSTSTGMMKETFVRQPSSRLDAQLTKIGVEESYLELFGGRSMIEHRPENENGLMVAERLREAGFEGCWVISLGTNDAANVAKHPKVPHVERIDRMMQIIGDDPVLWIDAVTQTHKGYWAAYNMQVWNDDLATTLSRYPNARIYRWSADMIEDWWAKDKIHYNADGYAARAALIPQALAAAFPGE
jgi:hypothetical protein